MLRVKLHLLFLSLLLMLTGSNAIAQLTFDTLAFPSNYSQQEISQMRDIEVDANGGIWTSFYSIGVLHYDGATWQAYNTTTTGNLLPTDSVSSLYIEPGGAIWMLTRYGLTRKDSSGFSFYSAGSFYPLPISFFTDMTVARGQVFISSISGVLVYDIGSATWQSFNQFNSLLPSNQVGSLYTDQTENVWVSTGGGFVIWSANGMTPFTISNSGLPSNSIYSIAVTPFDTLIAGYKSVYRKNGNIYTNIDSLYSRVYLADEWCDSLSFGYLSSEPDVFEVSSKLLVAPNYDVYAARRSLPSFILVIKPGNIVRTASIPANVYLNRMMAVQENDSIVCFPIGANCLKKCATDEASPYQDPPAALDSISPEGFSFSIPPSYQSNGYMAELSPNMISTRILNQGDLGWDPYSQTPYYNVPRYSEINSIWNSAIWLGGYDQQGNLYTAAQINRSNGSNDFYPGPLDTIGKADSAARVFFNNIWVTRRTDIDEFRYQFAIGNVQNGSFPVSPYILNWPAFYNNPAFPQKLAPFVDINNDGLYNPYDGDFPDVKGEQMSWCVYNDDLVKTETNSPPLFTEIHASAYGYYCPSSQDALSRLIAYTTFYHYELYNRSDRTYDSCYFGIFAEFDLGDAADDYVGCNVTNNSFYAYNADSLDYGGGGFGWCPPVQNITFLKGPSAPTADGKDNNHNGLVDEVNEDLGMSTFLYWYNENNSISSWPYLYDDYYDYLVSRWLDGTPVTFGGDGKGNGIGATNIPTSFMYPDTTDPNFSVAWTMPGAGRLPDDIRGNGSSGPFTWPPDSMVSFDVAYITGPNDLVQNHDLVRQLREIFRNGEIERYRKFSSPIIGPDTVANAGTIVSYMMPTDADNYIWTVTNGLIISGQGTNTVEVTWGTAGIGTITAEAFDTGAPCERKQEMKVVVGPPLAGGCDGELTVRLYPNPTRSILQIESACDSITEIRVWSVTGQFIETKTMNGSYNASRLPSGVYVLEMLNTTGETKVRKMFVKY